MIFYIIVALWLYNGSPLPTSTGFWLEARETFETGEDCMRHIQQYEKLLVEHFHSEGLVVCIAQGRV